MTRVVVTGSSGFIGTNLVAQLLRDSRYEILGLDSTPPRLNDHLSIWHKLDVCDGAGLSDALRGFRPAYIFHLAARTDLRGTSISDYAANTEGVTNLIEAAAQLPELRRVVFASSLLVCELGYLPKDELDFRPNTVYGESKVLGERMVRERATTFPWVIVRPTSIWGPWFGEPYRDFFESIEKGRYFHASPRSSSRSFGFVLNTVLQLERVGFDVTGQVDGHVYYLADYEPLTVRQWAEIINSKLGGQRIRSIPLPALRVAASIGDVLRSAGMRNPPLTSQRLRNLLTDAVYDVSPLRSICGAMPYSLEEGVQLTVDWLRSPEAKRSTQQK